MLQYVLEAVKVVSHIGLILAFYETSSSSCKYTFLMVLSLCKKLFITDIARMLLFSGPKKALRGREKGGLRFYLHL